MYFESMTHPKNVSGRICELLDCMTGESQGMVAAMFGYLNWQDLEEVTQRANNPVSRPDRLCSPMVVDSRRDFQHRVLFELTTLKDHQVDDLLDELRPTDSFESRSECDFQHKVDLAFPPQWKIAADGSPIERQKGLVYEVDTTGYVKYLKEREIGALPSVPTPAGNWRTLTIKRKEDENTRLASLVFRVQPTIEENIIVALDVTIEDLEVTDLDDYLFEDAFATVEALVCYLNSPCLAPWSDLELSGAMVGVHIRLHGITQSSHELAFVHALDLRLSGFTEIDDYESEAEHDRLTTPLWVGSVQNFVDIDGGVDAFVEGPLSEWLDDCASEEQSAALAAFLKEMPKKIAVYLTRHGAPELSDFVKNQTVDTPEGIRAFAESIRAIAKTGALPQTSSIALRHLLVHSFVQYVDFDESADSDESEDWHIKVANEMKDEDLASYFAQTSDEDLQRDLDEGMSAILGDAPA
ncbi:hypothetical protein LA345_40445 (plasmid) [Burkholderia vietnamiensis]|nr:hypothetical protein [Burkholderia vietnamiensis]